MKNLLLPGTERGTKRSNKGYCLLTKEFASQNPRPLGGPQWKQLNRQRWAYLMPDFCRIFLPIRNPEPGAAEWVRINGSRTYAYQTPLITRKSLRNQMGSNYAETRNFVTRFKQSQNHEALSGTRP